MVLRPLRRGQAEIVGGLIVVSAFLIVLLPLLISLMTTSTIVTTRIHSARSQFEIDRWSERLQLVRDGDAYLLKNVGSVAVEVVRVWYGNGTVREFSPWVAIEPGASVPIARLGAVDYSDIDLVVTSRGRIFRMVEVQPPAPPAIPPTVPTFLDLLAKNITLGYYLVGRYNGTYGVTARYSTDGVRWSTAYVAYHNGTTWFVFNASTCSWSVRSLGISPGSADLDGNNITELVLLDSAYGVVNSGTSKTLAVSLTLYECHGRGFIRLTRDTELLMIFFKFVAVYDASDVNATATIVLREVGGTRSYSSAAVFSRAKVIEATIRDIYQGYIIYPIRGFIGPYDITGDYNLEMKLSVVGVEALHITVNAEYVAVIKYP